MIYLVLFILFLIGAILFDNPNKQKRGEKYYWFCFLALSLVFGFRYRVGGDTLNYIYKYEMIPDISNLTFSNLFLLEVEPGFAILMSLVKHYFNSFYGVQVIESLFVNFTIFRLLKNHVDRKFLGVMLYYIMSSFYFNTEIMREAIAICFFVFAFECLTRGEKRKYYLWLIPGILFHYSCLFMLIVPVLYNKTDSLRKVIVLSLCLFLMGTVASPVLNYFGGYLSIKIANTSGYHLSIYGVISMFIKTWVFPYLVCMLYKKYINNSTDDKYVRFIYMYMIIGSLSFGNYSMLMRLSNYMQPMFIVALTLVLQRILWSNRFSIALLPLAAIFYFNYIMYYTSDRSKTTAGAHYYNLWYPYHSILDEQVEPLRETFVADQFEEIHNR